MAPAANHAWYMPTFYWLNETAACYYFGVDLGKRLDHYFPSRLTDGTPRSSSDLLTLLSFSLLLGQSILSPTPFLRFSFLDQNILGPTSILQKHFGTLPNSLLAAESFQFYKIILSPFSF